MSALSAKLSALLDQHAESAAELQETMNSKSESEAQLEVSQATLDVLKVQYTSIDCSTSAILLVLS